jgi:anti-sigma regulatory factor (Ser/Thr protein kinase)
VTLDQQFDEATLHIVRETVLAHATAMGMPDERALDVMLAVHELAANAVRHGGGSGRIQMQVTGGELVCRVSDYGPGSRNGQPPGSKPDRQQHPIGSTVPAQPWPYQPGHGLWLVRQVADRISVVSGPAGSQVTAVFALVPSNVAGDFAGPGPAR